MAKGTKVIRVERLRTADASPMAYEVGYYPSALFPGLLGRELGTLYDVFASEYDVVVTSGEQTVRADNADGHVARVLGVARRAPLLVLERTTLAGRKVVERVQNEVLESLDSHEREALMDALGKLVCGPLAAPAACQHGPRRKA